MSALLNQMQEAVRARSAYRRTVHELRTLPLDVALDLDIDRDDVRSLARNAVYGR